MVTNVKRNINANNEKEYMKQYGQLYYQEHKNELLKKSHDRYLKNRPHLLEGRHRRYLYDKDGLSIKSHNQYYQIRREILQLLGNKCSNPNCDVPNGMADIRALQIDHINGGGRKEVKSFPNSVAFYKFVLAQVKASSKDYQLLCANCNQIKRYEKQEGMGKDFKTKFLQ